MDGGGNWKKYYALQSRGKMLGFLRFLPHIAAVILFLSASAVGYIKGASNCEIKKGSQDVAAVKDEVDRNDKINKKNELKPDSAIFKRLDKWVRPS
jgi:hypothetical protein